MIYIHHVAENIFSSCSQQRFETLTTLRRWFPEKCGKGCPIFDLSWRFLRDFANVFDEHINHLIAQFSHFAFG